ncbi:MAG: eukaryotic-like serine/threonine-protein kinase [Myxococcales bacterium]|nr:eukaryotic-like serine/threonine-protein kinase [Myxococcales bacterium]
MEVTPTVRLVSKLGAGGMGAVWLADHTALNTRVVVKFMLVGLDSSTSARARFKREAEAASQVKSPHVVQTFDYGVTADGLPFIVMEHLEGRDLAAEIAARGALEPVMVITIVTQVAKALTKAHAAGLLHRDIKPDNIFLCQSESEDDLFVKLLDFGIAKTHAVDGEADLDAQTKTGQVIGTPFYMSPEQVTAQKVIDLRSDLWSLAVVAFEALTGQRPYDGPSFGALAVKIATTDAPKPSAANPALPPSVDAWFAQACAREPSARFGSARELAERLRASFEGVVSLPPIASGAMSDSGARAGASGTRPTAAAAAATTTGPSTPVDRAIQSIPAGPISVDDDAHSRPSFVLASTVQPDATSAERAALARSEGGGAVAVKERTEDSVHRRGPSARMKVLVPMIALATILGAIAIGWKAKERSADPGATGMIVDSANPKNASSNAGSAPVSAEPIVPATNAPVSTAPVSAVPVSAGGAPSASASTSSSVAMAAPSAARMGAVATPAHTPSAHPRTPAAPSATAKLTPSAEPTTRPTATSQDPLY